MVVFTALGGIFPSIWEDVKSALVSTSPDIAPYVGNYIILLIVFFIIVFIIFRQRIVPDLLNIKEGTQLNSASFIFSLAFTLLVFFSGVLKPLAVYSATIILLLIVLLIVYGIMKLIRRVGGISSGGTSGGGGGGGRITIKEIERREKETEKDVKKIREDEGRIKKGFNALRGHLADLANFAKSGGYKKETRKKMEEKAKLIGEYVDGLLREIGKCEKHFNELKNVWSHPSLEKELADLESLIKNLNTAVAPLRVNFKSKVVYYLSHYNYKGLEIYITTTERLIVGVEVTIEEIDKRLEEIDKESEKAFEEEKKIESKTDQIINEVERLHQKIIDAENKIEKLKVHSSFENDKTKLNNSIEDLSRRLLTFKDNLKLKKEEFLSKYDYKGLENYIAEIQPYIVGIETFELNKIFSEIERISKESEKAFEEEKKNRT